jgi:hypothetical protein
MATYEVMYNRCYGGFTIPEEVQHRVFSEFPPHTEIGSKLFETNKYTIFIEKDEEPPADKKTFYRINSRIPFQDEYDRLEIDNRNYNFQSEYFYVQHQPTKNIYYHGMCSYTEDNWRKSPQVISIMKEMGYIGKDFGYSNIKIAEVPNCCSFSISDYDGMESVHIVFPYRRTVTELLQYIDDHDETKLSEVSRKLVSKEMKLSDISHY